MNDRDVIRKARQGDNAAWESLVEQHREAVFRLAYLLLGDAAEADDAAQDAFIRAYRGLGRFDPARPMRPWLLRITANVARNRQRAAGRYLSALRRWVYSSPEAFTSAETESTQAWESQLLWRAVRRLSRSDQEIIYMRYFLELSVAETAEALDIAPGTIKSRLHRALKHLRAVVEREFPSLAEGYLA